MQLKKKDRSIFRRFRPNAKTGLSLIVICFAAAISFYRLGWAALENWDEAFYADGMRHIITTHQLIVPYWNQAPFLDKPPLHLWLGSLGRLLVGNNPAGYRFTSAVSTFLTLIAVFVFTKRKFGLPSALTAFLVLACNPIFIWRGRGGNTDGLLTLLIFSLFLLVQKNFRGKYLLTGLLLSLIYMTKSTVVAFALLAVGWVEIVELWQNRRHIKWFAQLRSWCLMLIVALIIPSIWLRAGSHQYGPNFINFYLWQSDFKASSLSLSYFHLKYIIASLRSLGLMAVLVSGGVIGMIWQWYKSRSLFLTASLAFGLPLLIGLSLSQVYYHWYLMPIIPIWAVMVGYAIHLFRRRVPSKLIISIVILVIGLVASWQFYRFVWPIYDSNSAYHQAATGQWLYEHTQPDEVVVRLDQIYPSFVFYTQRRVLVSTTDTTTYEYFVSHADLMNLIKQNKLKWFGGNLVDVNSLAVQLKPNSYLIHPVTDQESVLEIIKP